MTVDDARDWIDALDNHGVVFWVDGGWGVDALLGEQTRPHGDLDLVVEAHHEPVVVDLLRGQGYAEVPTWFSTSFHSVWRDDAGREVDLHVITMDDQGNGQFGPDDVYPAAGPTRKWVHWWTGGALHHRASPARFPFELRP